MSGKETLVSSSTRPWTNYCGKESITFMTPLSIDRVSLLTRGETSHGDTEDTEQVVNPEEIDIDEDEDEDDNEEGT